MALVPATIPVSWTAQTVGPHRVCYRIVGAPSYTCTTPATHPNCPTIGASCGYDIDIMVDNETCDQVDYEGYVQPACEDEVSLVGRVPFAVSFIPDPSCKRYEATCERVGVDSATMILNGSGYNAGAPTVTISGGGGAGATATADVGTGFILGLSIDIAGTGYNDGVYGAVNLIGGTGAGATASITIVGGAVTIATLVAPGNGYTTGDILAPDTGVVGVPVTPADLGVTSDLETIINVNITAPGSNYTSPPAIIIDPPPAGVTATAFAVMLDCGALTITDCTGVSGESHPSTSLLQIRHLCSSGQIPIVPPEYGIAEATGTNCLCECQEVDMVNTTGGSVDVQYIACNGAAVAVNLPSAGPVVNDCIVTGSLSFTENGDSTFDLTVVGPCDGV